MQASIQINFQPYPYGGAYIDPDLAFQMALGNVDLNSLKIVGFYDPGKNFRIVEFPLLIVLFIL